MEHNEIVFTFIKDRPCRECAATPGFFSVDVEALLSINVAIDNKMLRKVIKRFCEIKGFLGDEEVEFPESSLVRMGVAMPVERFGEFWDYIHEQMDKIYNGQYKVTVLEPNVNLYTSAGELVCAAGATVQSFRGGGQFTFG